MASTEPRSFNDDEPPTLDDLNRPTVRCRCADPLFEPRDDVDGIDVEVDLSSVTLPAARVVAAPRK
jgi:hypothetical protein